MPPLSRPPQPASPRETRSRRLEDSHATIENLRVPGLQDIYGSLDSPSPSAMWSLGNLQRPDFAAFEEIAIPATPDWVFQHPPDREPGRRNWGRNHWGLTLFETVRVALQRAGVGEDTDLTDRGDETVAVTFASPRRRRAALAALHRSGLLVRRGYAHTLVVARPRVGVVVRDGDGWTVRSKQGKSLGHYGTKAEAVQRLRQVEFFKSRKAAGMTPQPATIQVPGLQTTDPTRTVQQQLQGIGQVAPGPSQSTSIQTPNPAQTLQQTGQLLRQGKLTINPQHPAANPADPNSPTPPVVATLRRVLRRWGDRRWFRGATADRRGVHVRVACGCGGAMPELPQQLGPVPIHILVLRAPTGETFSRSDRDEDRGEEVTATPLGPSRKQKIAVDPVYRERYEEAVRDLEAMRRRATDPAVLAKQERLVHYRRNLLAREKEFVRTFRRPKEWTSSQGIDRILHTHRTEHGGIEDFEDWYTRHRPIVEHDFGADRSWGGGPDVFHALLGVTSSRTKVGANVTKAIQNYRALKRHVLLGEPLVWVGVTPAVRKQLDDLARGELPQSPKIGPFTRALIDPANAPDDDVVVDMWMEILYFGRQDVSDEEKEFIRRDIRRRAKETGQPTRFVQALLWDHVKKEYDRARKRKTKRKQEPEMDYRQSLTHPRRRQMIEEVRGITPPEGGIPQGRRFPSLQI